MRRRVSLVLPTLLKTVLLMGTATLYGCTAPEIVPPAAQPVPVPVPTPQPPAPRPTSPAPVPPPAASDWRDWPVTPGSWVYRQDERGSIALFGRVGEDAELTLRCDRARSRVYLSRRGGEHGTMTVRTSSTLRNLTALPTGGTPAYHAVELAPRDPLLDAMGYSRGRFVIEQAALPTLVVPAWAEIERVTEDCRQ